MFGDSPPSECAGMTDGLEVTNEVFQGPNSIVFQQAAH